MEDKYNDLEDTFNLECDKCGYTKVYESENDLFVDGEFYGINDDNAEYFGSHEVLCKDCLGENKCLN